MTVYISGGITNDPDHMIKFERAERLLTEKKGCKVFNPAKIAKAMPKLPSHEAYMEFSFMELGYCDAVYFLQGWQKSCGASQERGWAIAMDKIIIDEEEEDYE